VKLRRSQLSRCNLKSPMTDPPSRAFDGVPQASRADAISRLMETAQATAATSNTTSGTLPPRLDLRAMRECVNSHRNEGVRSVQSLRQHAKKQPLCSVCTSGLHLFDRPSRQVGPPGFFHGTLLAHQRIKWHKMGERILLLLFSWCIFLQIISC